MRYIETNPTPRASDSEIYILQLINYFGNLSEQKLSSGAKLVMREAASDDLRKQYLLYPFKKPLVIKAEKATQLVTTITPILRRRPLRNTIIHAKSNFMITVVSSELLKWIEALKVRLQSVPKLRREERTTRIQKHFNTIKFHLAKVPPGLGDMTSRTAKKQMIGFLPLSSQHRGPFNDTMKTANMDNYKRYFTEEVLCLDDIPYDTHYG
ncbi:hypothetical protein EGR_01819 [Echinococcus granulosus]|uniref:Uncharacterized protein n=1 Tax=Echinococcus granulosus TaxID=6210 RepID=W6UQ16_ECHGR|nr:hypothetical protein EGR_01819 [Echinococcus granulosus]EUB63328.1 hypothetical protein EGR_01819 [Echinococcus granulosus]